MSTITKGNAVKPIAIIHPGRLSCSFNSIADVATALEAAGYVVAVGLTGNGAAIEAIGPRLYRGTRAVYHEHRAAGRSISASLIVAVRHYLGLP